MIRYALFIPALVGALLVAFVLRAFAGPTNCVSFPLTGTSESTVVETLDFSSPWVATLTQVGCADTVSASANFHVYGPCLDSGPASLPVCHHGAAIPLVAATPGLTAAAPILTGPGPIDAVSVKPVALPSPGLACVGGANDGVACTVASQCPSGRCGPCFAVAAFCGVNPGVVP